MVMAMKYSVKSHKKFKLLCHMIFSTKYRRNIFQGDYREFVRNLIHQKKFEEFEIEEVETDKDHIHFLISYTPDIALNRVVQNIKSYITYHSWLHYKVYML